jgi:hypothetical protein
MGEIEALIRRRDMLLERILNMNHEIEKLDGRLAFLGWKIGPESIELIEGQEMIRQEVA